MNTLIRHTYIWKLSFQLYFIQMYVFLLHAIFISCLTGAIHCKVIIKDVKIVICIIFTG